MKKQNKKAVIAQIGLGGWGINLVKNFSALDNCQLKMVCDLNEVVLKRAKEINPQTITTRNVNQLLMDKEIEAIVVATPAPLHFKLAEQALVAGKHVYIEKPMTLEVAESQKLVSLAKRHNKKIMVGHLLLYHPGVIKLKQLIKLGELGKVFSICTKRLNLGKVRNTENALWSLAPHDISIILHLMKSEVVEVVARGGAFLQKGIEDTVFVILRFAHGELGHIHVSWLDPIKTRQTQVVGSKKMAVFDELNQAAPLKLLDRGVELTPTVKLRNGEATNVKIEVSQPLRIECQHFIDCLLGDQEPLSNGSNGLAVIEVLSAAQKSLSKGGSCEIL